MDRRTDVGVDRGAERRELLLDGYQSHRHAVLATARRVCGRDDAFDVAQEVFVRLWRDPDAFDPARGSLRAYLVTMARGIAIDAVRRDASRARRDTAYEADIARQEDVDDALGRLIEDQEASAVRLALARLDPRQRQLVIAAFYGELSYREVSRESGLPEGTTKARIRAGLRELRIAMSGGTLDGA